SESRYCLDGFLQFLRRTEGDFLARLDLDRLAGCRVAAHAGGALAHLQDAEASDANPVALLQVLHDDIHHAAEDGLSLFLGEFVPFGDVRRDVLQGNGGSSRLGWSGRHGYSSPLSDSWEHASYARPISDSRTCDYVEMRQPKTGTGKLLR